jgi:hypothetical protein
MNDGADIARFATVDFLAGAIERYGHTSGGQYPQQSLPSGNELETKGKLMPEHCVGMGKIRRIIRPIVFLKAVRSLSAAGHATIGAINPRSFEGWQR